MKNNNQPTSPLNNVNNTYSPQQNLVSMSLVVVGIFLLSGYSHSGYSSEGAKNEKTKCIAQLSLMERMAITHLNLYSLNSGDPVMPAVLVENGYISKLPVCPSGGNYSYTNKGPSGKKGSEPYASCDHKGHSYSPYQADKPKKNQPSPASEKTRKDKAKCAAQLSLMERLATAHCNINAMDPGSPLPSTALVNEGYIKKLPACPAGGNYSYTNKAPSGKKGATPYAHCDHKGHTYSP